jgi:hypothetical protein
LTARDHSPVNMTWQEVVGSTARAPSRKELMLSSTCGICLAATKPIFLGLDMYPAKVPLRYYFMPI